jgi:hypothetical protein
LPACYSANVLVGHVILLVGCLAHLNTTPIYAYFIFIQPYYRVFHVNSSSDSVGKLMTIDGVGEITALTWVLEIGDQTRFSNSRQAISHCGLCSAQKESAGKEQRGPISQKRNRHLQTILIEAAKLAPYWNPDLAVLREKEFARGNRNRATLAIARKLVEYLLAVDRRGTPFITEKPSQAA